MTVTDTIIELFDTQPMDNVAAHLVFPDTKIIYFGSKDTMTNRRKNALVRFFSERGTKWTPDFIALRSRGLDDILSAVDPVIKAHPDCVLDCTGGEDMTLAAAGILSERNGVPLIRVNYHTGKCAQLNNEKMLPAAHVSPFSVSELALLHGGRVTASCDEEISLTPDLESDVLALQKLTSRETSALSRISSALGILSPCTNGLAVDFSPKTVPVTDALDSALKTLTTLGLIKTHVFNDERVCFSYKNSAAKQLLTKSGLTLELFTRLAAEKSGVFTDIRQGVCLDWDGETEKALPTETKNEADVILMRGMMPVFISCKSGDVKKEALYELDVVAKRFGGKYAGKALVCSLVAENSSAGDSLRRRARDMGIRLIDNASKLTVDELALELRSI